ncbi:hypothetical protein B0H14DRAFT_2804345 [Mycena olivaceomarginata]|nr:hypothetical protein B0H14DRAFT_2804345 [Mycena olivaceomarginata]
MEDRVTKSGLDVRRERSHFNVASDATSLNRKRNPRTSFLLRLRDKEAIENERKNLSRNQEKQGKIVERLVETEPWKRTLDKYSDCMRRRAMELSGYKRDVREQKQLQEAEASKAANFKLSLTEREKELSDKKAELQKLSEELQAVQLQERAAGSSSSREAELEKELKLTMNVLKCSACKGADHQHSANHVWTPEISTRQRKCPACNLPFGVGEVQTIYLQ